MSLGSNQNLARKVASATEEWSPSEDHNHESSFQNELQQYLDRRLNSSNTITSGEIVVEREHGNVNGDVVVNGDIGIEMKRDFTNSQAKKLRGQIEEYQKEYTHVICCACGIEDMDGWRKLRNDYENQAIGMNPDSAPVKFIHKQKGNYGADGSTGEYPAGGGGNNDVDLDEIAEVLQSGVTGYRSLAGDGPMNSGEAVVAVVQAVVVVGVLLAIVGFILFNFLL
jgi:hypothetical protein